MASLQTGLHHHQQGRLAEAERCYRLVLQSQPDDADALHLLGILCHQSERNTEAATLIARALRSAPNNRDYQDSLANVYLHLQRFEEAAGLYRRLLRRQPQDSDTRSALCTALMALGSQCHQAGRYDQAEACYAEAVQVMPGQAVAHYNLGNAQRELGKPAEAALSYQRALKGLPDDADVHNNLGNVLRELGQLDQAVACYETALRLNPSLFHARVHLAHQKQHLCDWSGLEADITLIRDWVSTEPTAQISPFAFLAMPGTTAAEQRRCADNWLANRYGALLNEAPLIASRSQVEADARADKRIRLGYLSADFRLHPLAFLITDLIEQHDRSHFEVLAYSYGPDDHSAERERLKLAFDQFVDIRPLSLRASAQRIRDDNIDILIDLTGYTQTSRSGIAALRPAPVQINWLGYPGTMGAHAGRPLFDYLITDAVITPASAAAEYAEQLLTLPCYQPNSQRPLAPKPTRAKCGLPEQAFVYCCFNQTFKITPTMFAVWMDILKQVPHGVLWLLECNRWAKANLLKAAAGHGISAERLIFAPRAPIDQHLARMQCADLFLDTLPYNAHTTASDALFVGLPVLTCMGHTFASRVAASLLQTAGLADFICTAMQDYAAKAVALPANSTALDEARTRLQNAETRAMFDASGMVHGLETVLAGLPGRQLS
ncbi:glycosyltransferase family 41 protein [Pseudomethylobacillus aquaticus]|uniref:protein O-GlcNAc transferase n=1 Tax=Pseudomethylobacillus aquaticus TaxID=2676064 RepID=A0A3N0UYA1_9PROT|nr:glycosyltransferase family 41 protein [Pseudomethylobacillus aquaticus]ROH85362.1 glycosyltransferase family 41 protein [Pseudomethylobacillus aquaticus]